MLQDMLIEGTGEMPPIEQIRAGKGPRVYRTFVKQGHDPVPNREAYCFVGVPDHKVNGPLKQGASNYRAVLIPMDLLPGVDPDASKAILLKTVHTFIILGLRPSPSLRRYAVRMGYLARDGTEGMVFTSPEDFSGFRL